MDLARLRGGTIYADRVINMTSNNKENADRRMRHPCGTEMAAIGGVASSLVV